MALAQIDHVGENEQMAECIDNCLEAAQACEWCADECLGDEGMEECARLCRDVADLTTLHARFMARNSNYGSQLAQVCAEACEDCADECERHDAEHCKVCADVLRDCAETCREMANA
ncbi:four-helix bundle copper-binding protein [Haloarchaeobius salinus]|uniref:four-helix bundle copper-binding protein n=1 Tax=Haloarchaeobius salinus TaxID=1198298 RepID=UPI002108F3EF|nr:four-helix bundle copper-binding protein [Haloarchaeobius salinus]